MLKAQEFALIAERKLLTERRADLKKARIQERIQEAKRSAAIRLQSAKMRPELNRFFKKELAKIRECARKGKLKGGTSGVYYPENEWLFAENLAKKFRAEGFKAKVESILHPAYDDGYDATPSSTVVFVSLEW